MVGMGSIVFHVIQRIELTVKSDVQASAGLMFNPTSILRITDIFSRESASIAALKSVHRSQLFRQPVPHLFNLNNTMCGYHNFAI